MLNPLKHLAEPMVLAAARDMTEHRAAEDQRRLLIREVNHRANNILSVVQAIAHQTEANSCQEFIAKFDERIQSLRASTTCWSRANGEMSRSPNSCALSSLTSALLWTVALSRRPGFENYCEGGPGDRHDDPRAGH
jgi:two-component sensor histidine kinase